MLKILQKENLILRKTAKEIKKKEISSAKIQSLIKEMFETLNAHQEGAALSAPQIGESLRIFVISDTIEGLFTKNKKLIYINPKIIKESKKRIWAEEGCLSVEGFSGQVSRAVKCSIEAYDENGDLFIYGASGLLAQIFQHETDHLEGILFIDKARNLKKIN